MKNRLFTTVTVLMIALLWLMACAPSAPQIAEKSPEEKAATDAYNQALQAIKDERYDEAMSLLGAVQGPEGAAVLENARKLEEYVGLYLQAKTAYDVGDYAAALEHLDAISGWKNTAMRFPSAALRQAIESRKAAQEKAVPLIALADYLQAEGVTDYELNDALSRNGNLRKLFLTSEVYKDNAFAQSKLLAALGCYDVIARGFDDLVHQGIQSGVPGKYGEERYGHDGDSPTLSCETVLLSMIELCERGDESEDYTYLMAKLEELVQTASSLVGGQGPSLRYGVEMPYYLSLLAGYEPDPALFALFYSDITDYMQPGTVDYAIVHAPKAIKDVLLSMQRETWPTGGIRPRLRSFEERDTLFRGFVPSQPVGIGYIYFIDPGDQPEGVIAVPDVFAYEGDTFFCPISPARARIAISEAYSYEYYGNYTVQGTSNQVPVYLPTVRITVVDLVTGETLLEDSQTARPQQDYQVGPTVSVYCPINFFDRSAYLADALADKLPSLRQG